MKLFSLIFLSCLSATPLFADEITLESDATTLAASAPVSMLNTGDTTGLTFSSAIVGAFGTFTPVPTGAPSTTEVINIPPANGQNGYFEVTFNLPTGFSNIQLSGAANVDDGGAAFLNGNLITPTSLYFTEFGNLSFSIANDSFFQPGQNVLLISDNNYGGGPSGAAFYANVTFNSAVVPEPSIITLFGLGLAGFSLFGKRFISA